MGRNVLASQRMRVRITALLLALAVGAMAPAPLSACALLAGLPADCQPKPHCEGMSGEQPAAKLEANLSCCKVTSAPIPQASGTEKKTGAPEISATLDTLQPLAVAETPFVRAEASPSRDASPPRDGGREALQKMQSIDGAVVPVT